jgi:hypothetical protein
VGVARRRQALAAIGHPDEDVAGWLGVDVAELQDLAGVDPAVVVVVFEREASRPGRCWQTRLRARRAGWVTWLAWDAIDTDPAPLGVRPQPRPRVPGGPPALPRVVQYHALASTVSVDEATRDLVMAWLENGARVEEIAAALRVSERHVLRYCRQLRALALTRKGA